MSPQLADGEFSSVFRLLTIFAYGTYADYLGEAGRGAGHRSPGPVVGIPRGGKGAGGPGRRGPPSPNSTPLQPGLSPRPGTRLAVLWAPD